MSGYRVQDAVLPSDVYDAFDEDVVGVLRDYGRVADVESLFDLAAGGHAGAGVLIFHAFMRARGGILQAGNAERAWKPAVDALHRERPELWAASAPSTRAEIDRAVAREIYANRARYNHSRDHLA